MNSCASISAIVSHFTLSHGSCAGVMDHALGSWVMHWGHGSCIEAMDHALGHGSCIGVKSCWAEHTS